jgi:hypothetical protein
MLGGLVDRGSIEKKWPASTGPFLCAACCGSPVGIYNDIRRVAVSRILIGC